MQAADHFDGQAALAVQLGGDPRPAAEIRFQIAAGQATAIHVVFQRGKRSPRNEFRGWDKTPSKQRKIANAIGSCSFSCVAATLVYLSLGIHSVASSRHLVLCSLTNLIQWKTLTRALSYRLR